MSTAIKLKLAEAVMAFQQKDLYENAMQLFKTLGYNTARTMPLRQPSWKGFKEDFVNAADGLNEKAACVNEWKEVQLLFQLTAEDMQEQLAMFKPTVNRDEPASFLFFVVELSGEEYSRAKLAAIAREMNKPFKMDVFILFKYNNHLTLSLIERRPNKKIMDRDVIEKITHIYNISITKPHAAHIHILYTFSFEAIEAEGKRKKLESFKDLQAGWKKVVSTQILNKQFYLDYKNLSVTLIRAIHPKQIKNKLMAHQGVLNLLNRLMFIYFVQKKEWIMKDEDFIQHFWLDYLKAGHDGKDEFHEKWLNSVFFSAFNGKAYKDPKAVKALPEPYKSALVYFPYLNGGLFAKNQELDNFILPDKYFHDIFNFFDNYIFTITEDTPYDVNLEINPELLGKMYEGMINATDLDDVDAEHGIVYTERPEINFMVRRSLVEVLDKKLEGKLSRVFLYHFIFDEPEQKAQLLRKFKADAQLLRSTIASVTVCDPACGSGSMLLGLIQVQMELLRELDAYMGKPHTPKDDFVTKKQLISECIYGVDIKEWAVRIAELRLWLYMIAEAEFETEELTKTPLLPNLDFKLRCGNSLLQKFGDLDFTIHDLLKGRDRRTDVIKPLNDFIKKKKQFILNQAGSDITYKELEETGRAVFLDFIQKQIIETEQRIQKRKVSQSNLFGESAKQADLFEEEVAKLKEEIVQLKQLRHFIIKERRLPFSYDIDFMEIFVAKNEDPGFDLVIGNPPYVRQEEILPPENGEYLEKLMKPENKTLKAKVNKAYKEELSSKVFKTYPFLESKQVIKTKKIKEVKEVGKKIKREVEVDEKVLVYGNKVPGRSDLYVYFQLLCPQYLNSRGTFCFIISNSWLDVDFGSFVQHFLIKHTALQAVYDCNVRSFEAAVNTIIYLHGAVQYPAMEGGRSGLYKLAEPVNNTARFVMNKIDYTQAAYGPLLVEQEKKNENTFTELYRAIPLSQQQLYNDSYDEDEKQFVGDKWGSKFLRAPEIYYTILNKGEKVLVPLKRIGTVEYGVKTGANDFFYLEKEEVIKWQLEKEYLVPVIKSPKECDTIAISRKTLKHFLFYCNKSKKELQGTNALKYINWGEKSEIINGVECRAFNERPSTKNRYRWWYVGDRSVSNVVVPKGLNDNFKFFKNGVVFADCRLYEIFSQDDLLAMKLNSTLIGFFIEITSRKGLGDGLLEIFVYEVPNLLVPNIAIKSNEHFLNRKQTDIFNELGLDRNRDIFSQKPNPLPDRKELDDIVFDAIGLTQEERNEVYWSLAELVKQRLDKAASR